MLSTLPLISLPSFKKKEQCQEISLGMWPSVLTISPDLIWIAQQYGMICFETSFNSTASDFFIFCCISPSIFLVHMITTRSFFGLKRETIRHFVKNVWKDWSWSKTDFLERLKSLQKLVLHAEYVIEAVAPIFLQLCWKLAH